MIKSLMKSFVPVRARPQLRRVWNRARYFGTQYQCPICRSRVQCFLPHAASKETCFHCPVCHSKPPHRLASVYFASHLQWFQRGGRLVHIAPEPELGKELRRLARRHGVEYRCGSIVGSGDKYLDLLNLPFADGSIELIYCCHVLNALQDDRRAMREVFRVLHPQGTALLQVPAFYGGPVTLETNSREERLAQFNDEGIFRCYTPDDYIARLEQAGFVVECYRAVELPSAVVGATG